MPHHPRNRLKLTGDTHLPDVGDLLDEADDIDAAAPETDAQRLVYSDGWRPAAPDAGEARDAWNDLPAPLMAAERTVERRVASTPWLAIGAALGFGFLVAKMLRN